MPVEHFITSEYLELLQEPEAKFLLDHAEKQLKDILDTNNLIVGRTTTLLTLTAGITITLLGYAIARWSNAKLDKMTLSTALVVLYLICAIFYMGKNLKSTSYMTVGAEPKLFFTNNVFNNENSLYRLKAIYANEIEQYQYRIVENKKINDHRWKIFNASYNLIKFTPIALVLAYLISILIFFQFSC